MERDQFPEGLPPPNLVRWGARRKAAVVMAVSSGMISLEDACRRYQMSEEEFQTWKRAFETYGLNGLRATSLRHDRDALYPSTTKLASGKDQ